jgi:hypothetical protein
MPDPAAAVDAGRSVLAVQGLAGDGPPLIGEPCGGSVVDPGRVVAGESGREVWHLVGAVDGVGLADVEHAEDGVVDAGRALVVAVLVRFDAFGGVAENLDRPLALADLAAAGLPLPESGDAGRVRALGLDQEHVAEAVAVEPGCQAQERAPAVGAGELLELGADRVVQAIGFGAAFLGGLAGLDLGHDASPRRCSGLSGREIRV